MESGMKFCRVHRQKKTILEGGEKRERCRGCESENEEEGMESLLTVRKR